MRLLDEARVASAAERAARVEIAALAKLGNGGAAEERRSALPGRIAARVADYLRRQPKQPDLVGVTAAAEFLGVPKPHVSQRLGDRMPEPWQIPGSGPFWIRAELVPLRDELAAEREERERRSAERAR